MSLVLPQHTPERARALASMDLEADLLGTSAILSGAPETRSRRWLIDKRRRLFGPRREALVWECTRGCLQKTVQREETIQVIAGSMQVLFKPGLSRVLASGDICVVPAGTVLVICVAEHVRTYTVRPVDRQWAFGRFAERAQLAVRRRVSLLATKLSPVVAVIAI